MSLRDSNVLLTYLLCSFSLKKSYQHDGLKLSQFTQKTLSFCPAQLSGFVYPTSDSEGGLDELYIAMLILVAEQPKFIVLLHPDTFGNTDPATGQWNGLVKKEEGIFSNLVVLTIFKVSF